MTIVQMLKLMPIGSRTFRIVAWRASPVMIPGSASGRMTRNEIVSRPKKRERDTASAASVPRTSAIAVAPSAAFTERSSASRTSGLCQATPNHFVV